jgi:hypothetical protein
MGSGWVTTRKAQLENVQERRETRWNFCSGRKRLYIPLPYFRQLVRCTSLQHDGMSTEQRSDGKENI